ncbi:MAG: glutamate-1-semialdehyde 2,1-aminomutase [Candidatus Omnitrophota bacterium]
MHKSLNYTNRSIFQKARKLLVGGVDSPVRAFKNIDGNPIPIKRGSGAKVFDYDGNSYVDYALSYGALILGHAYPNVIDGIKETAALGLGFGATHSHEVELAEILQKAIPDLERVRFVSSGTEAVMGALRLARGFTGRDKSIKFEGAYHGHADYLLAKAGSGVATLGLPGSKGVPEDFTRHTIIAKYGDEASLRDIFKRYGRGIAAVIVEPVAGNNGVIMPDRDFLKSLRAITREYASLLVFDEVITGFRFHFGSAAEYLGITPDLFCLGKIIGGGLPIGAYGGREEIMNNLAPLGEVYQASTFAGNPVVMRSGIETLRVLGGSKEDYKRLSAMGESLAGALREKARESGIDITVRQFGSMFSITFNKRDLFKHFYKALLKAGIYLAPSEHESNFISFAHKERDIKKTIGAAEKAFNLLKQKREQSSVIPVCEHH